MSARSVVVADDEPVVRLGLRGLFAADGALDVVGEADTREGVLEVVTRTRPDVVVVDIDIDNHELVGQILRVHPGAHVVVFSRREDAATVERTLSAGASAFVVKRCPPDELRDVVRTIARGQVYLSPTVARRLVEMLLDGGGSPLATRVSMTRRELDILGRLADGRSARAIADELGISERTVNSHIHNIYGKIGVHDRVSAVRAAVRLGLVPARA